MPTHSVKATIGKPIDILSKDLKIEVGRNGKPFGTLTVSKGSIDWLPTGKHRGKVNETTLGWVQFDTLMREARH